VLLVAAAVVAKALDSSPYSYWYDSVPATSVSFAAGDIGLSKLLLLWISRDESKAPG